MLNIFNVAVLLISLLAGQSLARNGCRVCAGEHQLTFSAPVAQDLAISFARNSASGCATGGDYQVGTVDGGNCVTIAGRQSCKQWLIEVVVGSYCGNGGLVTLSRPSHCSNNVCSIADTLTMGCERSVACKGNCVCKQCGC